MPIIGTSTALPTTDTAASVPISDVETANRITVDKFPLVLKPALFDIRVMQDTYLDFVFRDEKGNPYNLSTGTLKAYGRECVQGAELGEMAVSIVNAETGEIRVHVTTRNSRMPGVFTCAVICSPVGQPSVIIKENPFYLYITPSMPVGDTCGPPPLWELRLQLRDTSPSENLLFDGLNYADEEIAFAVKKSIMAFNEAPPIEDYPKYNSSNFPFPDLLKEGVLGQLCFMVAEYQRKNNLQYSAGGVSLNDKNKESNYLQMGQLHWQSFLQQSQLKKVNHNMETNWDVVHSAYAPYDIWI